MSSALTAPSTGACHAPGLGVGGEGSENFLGSEVCTMHNQMMPVSEEHVHVEGNIYEKFHACNQRHIFAILFFKYMHHFSTDNISKPSKLIEHVKS